MRQRLSKRAAMKLLQGFTLQGTANGAEIYKAPAPRPGMKGRIAALKKLKGSDDFELTVKECDC